MAHSVTHVARKADDFIIDRLLQPAVNLAAWHLRLELFTLARLCTAAGAIAGLAWVHMFDTPYTGNFFEDMLCLAVMSGAAFLQIRAQEAQAPRRAWLAPAIRLSGLIWRTLWLLDLVLFPTQWPLEAHAELVGNFAWTVLLVLPYWLICCRHVPPPERETARELRYATIPVR